MSSKCQWKCQNCLNQQYITLINFVLTRVILIRDSSTEFITRVSSKFYINFLSFIQITIQTKPVLKINLTMKTINLILRKYFLFVDKDFDGGNGY